MELILKNKQVNYEYNEDGTVKSEKVQGINYEVIKGEQVVGNANVYQAGFSLSVHNMHDKSIDEIQLIVEGLLIKSEEPEVPEEDGEEMPVDGAEQ